MFRVLYVKELRSAWPFAALALVVQGILCANRLEDASLDPIGVLEDHEFLHLLGILAVGFGLLLGIWQTFPESAMGTMAFLVQTARSRAAIVAAKISASATLIFASLIFPLLGTTALLIHRSSYFVPLTWSDTRYLWVICWAGIGANIGSVAIGIRGLLWKEGWRQACGAIVVLTAVILALAVPFLGWAIALLSGVTLLFLGWALTGLAVREF